MIDRIFNFLSSLKLTVVCLALAMVLVLVGTIAQVKLGLYLAQSEYFRSFFVYWQPQGASFRIPILPGGWLIGTVLMVNLLAAHAKRFTLSKKKIGIFMIHAGLIMLLAGQFLTEVFQKESSMRLTEGQAKNYSETFQQSELVVIDPSDSQYDRVASIPETMLRGKGEIAVPQTPLTLKVKDYWPNSFLTNDFKIQGAVDSHATDGLGKRYAVLPQNITTKMDEVNVPSTVVEVNSPKGSLGTFLLSSDTSGMQSVMYDNKPYQLSLRFKRYYNPYYIQLLKFTHERYKGTDVPKNFASRIRLKNPQKREDREVSIYMNNPLRYAGKTIFQGSFDPSDARVSIFQVVENPAWLTPYIACTLVGAGLLVQFLSHLVGFISRLSNQGKSDSRKGSQKPHNKRDGKVEKKEAAVVESVAAQTARRST